MSNAHNGAATRGKRNSTTRRKKAVRVPQSGRTARREVQGFWDDVRELGSNVTDAARDNAHEMRRRAEQYYEEGCNRVMGAEKSIEDSIRENPLKALMIAAGVGLAGGLLLFRRA